EKSKVR
ncbi:hypothetical protein D043_0038B, partial [Vibrio parahaemolyticus EKP-021]